MLLDKYKLLSDLKRIALLRYDWISYTSRHINSTFRDACDKTNGKYRLSEFYWFLLQSAKESFLYQASLYSCCRSFGLWTFPAYSGKP